VKGAIGSGATGEPGTVLVVDDDASLRGVITAAVAPVASRVIEAASALRALEVLREENVDVIVSDLRMPGLDGLGFLRRVREEQPRARFVLITAHGDMDVVIRALREGASDFLAKPFENEALRGIVKGLLRTMHASSAADFDGLVGGGVGMIGESEAFRDVLDTARKVARVDSPVLVTGETGTGKERLARFIHEASPRRDGPFIPVNCGAIPESLIESELFGHVRGAFTGAISDRPGKFTLAHGGTLFLDEIAEMPPTAQVRLLRALQERAVEPVGGSGPVRADFRLVAATHRDLRVEVRAGRFREDLRYRLHVVPIELPPLRERGDDILLLAEKYLAHYNARYGTSFALDEEHRDALLAHAWPGNVRELANAVERAVVLSEGGMLDFQLEAPEDEIGDEAEDEAASAIREQRRASERNVIVTALEACKWNKTQAAARLGISRRGLLYKVKEYGIG
jgi:two-component system response regulator AtoC